MWHGFLAAVEAGSARDDDHGDADHRHHAEDLPCDPWRCEPGRCGAGDLADVLFRQPAIARLLTHRVATVWAGVSLVGDTVLALGAVDKAHRPLMGGDSEGETERVQANSATEQKKRGL